MSPYQYMLVKFPKESIAYSVRQPNRISFLCCSQSTEHRYKMADFHYQQLFKLLLCSLVGHLLPIALISAFTVAGVTACWAVWYC